jgi:hypothetical protein
MYGAPAEVDHWATAIDILAPKATLRVSHGRELLA